MRARVQLATGFPWSRADLYGSLFYYAGLPLLLSAVLALFIQAVAPNKDAGMLLTGVFTLAAADIGAALGIEHPMLRFAHSPELTHSDMNGYGNSATAFHWYMAYWGALAALLGLASLALWDRNRPRNRADRVATSGPGARIAAAGCAIVMFASGGYIYMQTNVNGNYASTEDRTAWMAECERRFARYRGMPTACVETVRSDVALYPSTGSFTIKGQYRLPNRNSHPISQLLVASSRHATTRTVA